MHNSAGPRAQLESIGVCPGEIIPDGAIHRSPTEDKPHKRNGAYFCYPDGGGWALNHRTGEEVTWGHTSSQPLSAEERRERAEKAEAARKKREVEQARRHAEAANRASDILAKGKPCQRHPYLASKGVEPCPQLMVGMGGELLMPVLGPDNKAQSLQAITPDGDKKFLSGGKTAGGYFPIKGRKDGPLHICEGLSTSLSVHEATGGTVLVACNAGNLEAVARMARERYPGRPIIICGDDDHATPGNPGRTKAEAAARAVGGKVALPVFREPGVGTDFNDLHQAEGLETVKAQVEAAQPPRAEPATSPGWPELVPFGTHNAPPLPVEGLSAWAREFVLAAAEQIQVAPCLVLANVFGAVSACAARRFWVQVHEGYTEPVNLYLLVPAPPAERKSAAQAACLSPLFQWERDRAESMRDEIRAAASRRKSQEAIISGLRGKLAKAKTEDRAALMAEVEELELGLEEAPRPPRLVADDVTAEALASLMANNGERMAVISAEGGLFDTLGGRYQNGVPNLDLILKAHPGEPVRVDRKSGQPVMMQAPALTICISPQPDVLASLPSKPGFRGRGLLARFAYILPESRLGRRKPQGQPVPEQVSRAYAAALGDLLDLDPGPEGEPLEHCLQLQPAAHTAWAEFSGAIEAELVDGGRFENVRDWAGKLPGLAARLAGLLHVMEHLAEAPAHAISGQTMEAALELAGALAGHALAAFGVMGTDQDQEAAKKVLAWLKCEGVDRFTARDAHRAVRGSYPKAEQIRRGLEILEDRAFIWREVPPEKRGPGRAPSPTYVVNPKLWEAGS
ncbi:MAG: DUF3987 domain-containing protein [Desulfarculaceae bacterium]|nr:DUF3987 domain-containing protein [Desulfarculaceae bacterium]